MSTVMYCYKIPKDNWWEFFRKMRQHYIDNSITMKLAKACQETKLPLEYFEFCKDDNNHIETQLFDFGNDWIFRVLETGYYFHNKHSELFPELEEIYYDDRTVIPPEHKANEAISDKIEVLLKRKEYFIAYIVDFDSLFSNLEL